MKTLTPQKILLPLLCLNMAAAHAETAISFSPAPITSSVMAGQQITRGTLTYLSIETESSDINGNTASSDLTGFGYAQTTRSGRDDGVSAVAFNAMYLTGDVIDGISGNFYFGGESYLNAEKDLIGFMGPTLGMAYYFMEFDSGALNVSTDVFNLSVGLQAGIQKRFAMGDSGASIVPFAIAGWTLTGSSTTTATAFTCSFPCISTYDTTTTTDSFNYITTTLGFDITLPDNVSLAAMLSSGESDILVLNFGIEF